MRPLTALLLAFALVLSSALAKDKAKRPPALEFQKSEHVLK